MSHTHGTAIPLTLPADGEQPRFAQVDVYVCTRCHYTESYVTERADVHTIRQTWQRTAPEPEQPRMSDKYRTMPKPKPKDSEV